MCMLSSQFGADELQQFCGDLTLTTAQVSDAKRAGSREERQAQSSNTSGLKQMHSLGGAHNSPADAKAASSGVKAEPQPDGVNSPSAIQRPGEATAAPAKGQLGAGAPVPGSMPAGTEDHAVEVEIQTDTVMRDARPEPGEISNAASDGGHKGDEGEVANGCGLTVKLAVRVKGDEAAEGSPVAVLPASRLRDRYMFHNTRGAEGRGAKSSIGCLAGVAA